MKTLKLTKAIYSLFEKYPIYSQEGNNNARVLCKIFNPYGRGSWYITEAEKQENGDYLCFGLVSLFEVELGYFMLSDLLNVHVKVFGLGLPLERDRGFSGNLRDAYKDCGALDKYNEMFNMA
ncbi:MAG: DUF2958 domain-containing protein [Paludibacteraceae bacterium]|nr:DUF2958 domain-containing protein [Paludibacteraceae bacterium]